MTTALYPGSFDPVHNGHLAVIVQALALFDSVIVGVGHNPDKPTGLFDPEHRVELIRRQFSPTGNVTVCLFSGLVTTAATEFGADFLLKGLRGGTDLDAEMQQAHMNAATAGVPTVFLPATGSASLVSSTYVRQIARHGGNVSSVVPVEVAAALRDVYNGHGSGSSPDRPSERQ